MDLDDIEDIVKPGDLKPSDRYSNKKNVVLRVRKKNVKIDGNENEIVENGSHQSVSNLNYYLYSINYSTTLTDHQRNTNNLRQNLGMFA